MIGLKMGLDDLLYTMWKFNSGLVKCLAFLFSSTNQLKMPVNHLADKVR